jgi:hypothetical protein
LSICTHGAMDSIAVVAKITHSLIGTTYRPHTIDMYVWTDILYRIEIIEIGIKIKIEMNFIWIIRTDENHKIFMIS